ncbi:MAG: phosphopentomutase [Symbiobacteriaceae bacterium]|nr:phosphopentomutase [Symbiobacteriaceae bacterium]
MRTIFCILDSLGCGALPDAALYGDAASNTLRHILEAVPTLYLPNLQRLGLGHILELPQVPEVATPLASFGKMMMASPGKDTITGHWEMTGIRLERPFPLYPQGFPGEIITALQERIGRSTLGNVAASGTEIIERLGAEHRRTGYPIVYTSADSVFQIAAHEEVISLEELYHICQSARDILQGGHRVARVIARPFIGEPGSLRRTANRHDYAVEPMRPNLLTILQDAGISVHSIGKISDIFCQVGITDSSPTRNNLEGLMILEGLLAQQQEQGFYFLNLVDFDALYGHRNNPVGYAAALAEYDQFLPRLLQQLHLGDRLVITADHGCDPTIPGTDHTREYVPLLIYTPGRTGQPLGTRTSLADLAASECFARGLNRPLHGEIIPGYDII